MFRKRQIFFVFSLHNVADPKIETLVWILDIVNLKHSRHSLVWILDIVNLKHSRHSLVGTFKPEDKWSIS